MRKEGFVVPNQKSHPLLVRSDVQLSLFDGAPEDIDQTIFPTSGSEAGEVTRLAQQITHEAKR